jgi:hypothetical protein
MSKARLGVVFNIVFDLSAFSEPKTDDSSDFTSVNERDVVQPVPFRNQACHAQFFVSKPVVNPDKSLVPDETAGQSQRQAMIGLVQLVLGRIKVDAHALL